VAVRPADGVARWLLSDHLGSTAKTVSSGGSTEGEQRYMPYGWQRYITGTLESDYRFTGQRLDDNFYLYFYGSRWYDPVVGRFIRPDSIVPEPANPQALNRYAYTLNNPLKYVDPNSHSPLTWCLAGLASAGGNYTGQVIGNLTAGSNLKDALVTKIDSDAVIQAGLQGAAAAFAGETAVAATGAAYLGAGAHGVGGTAATAATAGAQIAKNFRQTVILSMKSQLEPRSYTGELWIGPQGTSG
jgi:RHS repeat-associated protein